MSLSPVVVALDYANADDALAMAARLDPARVRVKVGKELFTRSGPAVVEALHKLGFQVFLDLKFHDIPNTVAGAVRAAADMGVWMVNVHACGGRRMMEAARHAIDGGDHQPLLTAVTVLTSMGQEDLADIGMDVPPLVQVERLARLAHDCRLDGVVCSAVEAPQLRQMFPAGFALVTPGIRPPGAEQGDQTRVVTPRRAQGLGVDYMVIGRPITRAEDPSAAVDAILAELD